MKRGKLADSQEAIFCSIMFRKICEQEFKVSFEVAWNELMEMAAAGTSFAQKMDHMFGIGIAKYVVRSIGAFFERREAIVRQSNTKLTNLSPELKRKASLSKAPYKAVGQALLRKLVLDEEGKRDRIDIEEFLDGETIIERPVTRERFEVIKDYVSSLKYQRYGVATIHMFNDKDDLLAIYLGYDQDYDVWRIRMSFDMSVLGEDPIDLMIGMPWQETVRLLKEICLDGISPSDFDRIDKFKPFQTWHEW